MKDYYGNKNEKAYLQGAKMREQTLEDVQKFPFLEIKERGISKNTAERFGVRTELSEEDGATPIAHYFPYYYDEEITGYKKRDLTVPKISKSHFTVIGTVSYKCDLFGQPQGNKTGGAKVWITEGEYDQLLSWQTLKRQWGNKNPTVVSIGFGTASAIPHLGNKKNLKFLKNFKEVVTAFDNDHCTPEELKKGLSKGKEATRAAYGLLQEMKIVSFPEDGDACDLYKESGEEALYWALMKPIDYSPEGFTSYGDIRDSAIELPVLGKPWPWDELTKKTLGRRKGEGYFIGAGVKMGKSTFVDTLSNYIISNEKNCEGNPQKIALFKFEEQPQETVKKVAGKFFKRDFTNPEKIIFINSEGEEEDIHGNAIGEDAEGYYTHQELIDAADSVGPNLCLYNNYGKCSWDELKGAISHAVLVEHIEDIVIDPITRLTDGMSPSDADVELKRFSDEISKMAKDLGFTYYCFCHLKSPERGPSHERGGKVQSHQFAGSRAMMRACYYMVGIEGNKDYELPIQERNTRSLVILEDRKYGRSGKVTLYYNEATGEFAEEMPKSWVSETEPSEEDPY